MRAAPLVCAAALFASSAAGASEPASATALASGFGSWEQVKRAQGIVVERRRVDGSRLMEFRGRGIVEAPLLSILAVFNDVAHATEWMDSCSGSKVVEDVSEREKVVYNRTHAPWPVSDRDAVLRNVLAIDAQARLVRLDFETVSDPKAPPVKGVVRMPYLRGHWILWPSADGRSTRVEYQVHANPGGALPSWLVNYTSKDLPYKTILGLRAQLAKRGYPDFWKTVRARFPEYPFLAGATAAAPPRAARR